MKPVFNKNHSILRSTTIIMRHVLGQDDGELNQSTDDLLGIVFVPWGLVNKLLLPFLGNRVDIGGGIIQKMSDDLLRAFVVAFHQVAASGITVYLDGTVVLIQDFAVFGADCDGYVQAFEYIQLIHSVCKFSAKIEFF